MTSTLARSAARGALVTMSAQVVKTVLQLLSVVVLARLLTPHDYGLVTIVLVIVGVGEIFRDFGLTSASVQAPELSREQRDNLFWINVLCGLILTAIMFVCAIPIAEITQHPETLGIVQWLSFTFLLNSLAAQHRVSLMRELRFKALAAVDIIAAALALAVAIAVAILGGGYWALVAQQLVTGVTIAVASAVAARWWPRWYRRRVALRSLLAFGWNIVATNMLVYGGSQVDTVLVAAQFGPSAVGLYNRAYQLIMTPLGQVRAPMRNVALPILSRVQQEEKSFNRFVTGAQLALGYTLGLPLGLVAALASPIVLIALGPQWTGAADIARCFAVSGLLTTVAFVGYWIYLSRGLGKQLFRYTIVTTAIKVSCIVVGAHFGLLGIAIAFAVAPAISWPISLLWLSRVTVIPARALAGGAIRIISVTAIVTAAAAIGGVLAAPLGAVAQLAIGIPSGMLFALLPLAIRPFRRDLRDLTGFFQLMIGSARGARHTREGSSQTQSGR